MIHPLTAIAIATAGIGTFAAGAMSGSRTQDERKDLPLGPTFASLGLAFGGIMGGVIIGTTVPGRSLAPVVAATTAGLGAFLLGHNVIGPLFRGNA